MMTWGLLGSTRGFDLLDKTVAVNNGAPSNVVKICLAEIF